MKKKRTMDELEEVSESDLEFYDSGDGITFELWAHNTTGVIYEVPIEIVRDFKNMTKK